MSRRGLAVGLVGGIFQRLARIVVRRPVLVIVFWVMLAAALSVTFPPLPKVARERTQEVLPSNAPVLVATRQMTQAFREPGIQNVAMVVLTDQHGLTNADENVYRTLVNRLRSDTRDVAMVQDFISKPPLREVMTSKDNQAWFIPVGISGELGSPQSNKAYERVVGTVNQTVAGSKLTANMTGLAATMAELSDIGEHDVRLVETATLVMVLLILLVVYRNPVTIMLPLATIGVSMTVAQQLVSVLAKHNLGVSQQTVVFMTAMMVGAGVDYAVFLISRYHEYIRKGIESDRAVEQALASIGKVIAASAATVAVTFLGMSFTRLRVFSTVGPALAVAIGVAFLAAITLLPAILALAGRRGWVKPRRDLTGRFWRRSGIHIVRRPVAHLAASLAILIALASCAAFAHYTYDARTSLPPQAKSNVGYDAFSRHFPSSATVQQYIFVQSPHDMRNPKSLADLEQMAQRVSQLPNIASVRGITRPEGEPLEQAKLSYQAGELGGKLSDMSSRITGADGDLDKLTNGSRELADSLGALSSQVNKAGSVVNRAAGELAGVQTKVNNNKTLQEIESLVASVRSAGGEMGANADSIDGMLDMVGQAVAGLNSSPACDADPTCIGARNQLQLLVNARSAGQLDRIVDLARQLESTPSVQDLGATLQELRSSLAKASRTIHSLGLDNPGGLMQKLSGMQQGANALANGSRQVADGVRTLTDQTKQLGGSLSDAAAFLLALKLNASQPDMSGFYIPPDALHNAQFQDLAAVFMSADGHATRFLVQSKLNPFDTKAMDQVKSIVSTARSAQPNTSLTDASISMTGLTPYYSEMRDYYNSDLRLIILMTVLVVLVVLVFLLRAVFAPLYLVASVILSFLSSLGIGVIVLQLIGGQQLAASMPGMAFIVLVAVGADYNMLLISRIRDEYPNGIRSGVIRTVRTTGGVITSAGVIFAAPMFAMLASSTSLTVQAGFVIGVGLLLDTFLVRTITVPALAVLAGRANWWPSGWRSKRLPSMRRPSMRRPSMRRLKGRLVGAWPRVTPRGGSTDVPAGATVDQTAWVWTVPKAGKWLRPPRATAFGTDT